MTARAPVSKGTAGWQDPTLTKTVYKAGVASVVPNDNPKLTSHYVAVIGDTDTWTITNWRQGVPNVYLIEDTFAGAGCQALMSGADLVITFQTSGATSGTVHIERV